jgi:ribosome-associated translation inhibitor RaiA
MWEVSHLAELMTTSTVFAEMEVAMQMDIHAQPFKLTPALQQHVAQRVEQAIGTASKSVRGIRGIMVRLLDVNGERGGVDKTCRIVAWLRRGGSVIVEAVDRDLYAAIDAASVKLRVALGRRLNRRRTLQREYANRRLRLWPPDERHPLYPAWAH